MHAAAIPDSLQPFEIPQLLGHPSELEGPALDVSYHVASTSHPQNQIGRLSNRRRKAQFHVQHDVGVLHATLQNPRDPGHRLDRPPHLGALTRPVHARRRHRLYRPPTEEILAPGRPEERARTGLGMKRASYERRQPMVSDRPGHLPVLVWGQCRRIKVCIWPNTATGRRPDRPAYGVLLRSSSQG